MSIQKKDVVNITGGVQTEDGRTLYGLDAELYVKMKAQEDPDFERKVGEWIEDVIEHDIEDTSDLWKSLKTGIILVELVNKIRPQTVKKWNNKAKLHVLMERENINLYLEACWKLGLSSSEMFITADLHGRRNMKAVLLNIVALSDIASGFNANIKSLRNAARGAPVNRAPSKKEDGKPDTAANAAPRKHWNLEFQSTPIQVEELGGEEDTEYQLTQLKKQLQEALQKITTLENSNLLLKSDLKVARSKLRQQGDEGESNNDSTSTPATIPNNNTKPATATATATATDNSEKYKEEIEKYKSEIIAHLLTITTLKNEKFALEKQYNVAQEKMKASEKPKDDDKKYISELLEKISDLTQQLKDKENEIDKLMKEIEKLKQTNEALEKKIKKLTSESDDHAGEIEKLLENINNLNLLNQSLQNKISDPKNGSSTIPKTTADSSVVHSDETASRVAQFTRKRPVSILSIQDKLRDKSESPMSTSSSSKLQRGQENMAKVFRELEQLISNIFTHGASIQVDSVEKFAKKFKLDSVRRFFANFLRESIWSGGQGNEVKIEKSSFETIAFFIKVALDEMDLTNGADAICGRYILQASYFVVKKALIGGEYLHDVIKSHPKWKNLTFWDEYFWDKVSKNLPKDFDDGASKDTSSWISASPLQDQFDEQGFLEKELDELAKGMLGWGKYDRKSVVEFYTYMAIKIQMDESKLKDSVKKLKATLSNKTKQDSVHKMGFRSHFLDNEDDSGVATIPTGGGRRETIATPTGSNIRRPMAAKGIDSSPKVTKESITNSVSSTHLTKTTSTGSTTPRDTPSPATPRQSGVKRNLSLPVGPSGLVSGPGGVGEDLCKAVLQQDLTLVQSILNLISPDEINNKNSTGETALHCAARVGEENILRLLLKTRFASLNEQDAQGNTALHIASMNDQSNVLSILLSCGGTDFRIRNKSSIDDIVGFTAFQIAKGTCENVWKLYASGGIKALEGSPYSVWKSKPLGPLRELSVSELSDELLSYQNIQQSRNEEQIARKLFTIFLPSGEKKTIPYKADQTLENVLKKICKSRNISLDGIEVFEASPGGNDIQIDITSTLLSIQSKQIKLVSRGMNERIFNGIKHE
eukprot:TRINITY_DN4340_c0_g1_i2.p1 TRINITY_DN4340_c0_g1~~TRINITY_DN4340_c0_g1_i2.p1  ORF type:complete len:1104 (-),score=238.96 TRINITY_DN4340_c0_g1_i2:414-3725(-)